MPSTVTVTVIPLMRKAWERSWSITGVLAASRGIANPSPGNPWPENPFRGKSGHPSQENPSQGNSPPWWRNQNPKCSCYSHLFSTQLHITSRLLEESSIEESNGGGSENSTHHDLQDFDNDES